MKARKFVPPVFLIIFLFPCLLYSQFRSEYIKLESSYTIDKNKLTEKVKAILQINERMGDHDARISIYYKKGEKINISDVRIEDLNGNIIRKLSKKEIQDRNLLSNSSFYSDEFIKHFELKHNMYPYRIAYSYEKTSSNFIVITSFDYNQYRRPVREGKLTVETTNLQPIMYIDKNITGFSIDTVENTIRYAWQYSYIPPVFKETNSSVNISDAPKIEVIPLNFKYGVPGSFETWNTFGNYVYRLNKGRNILPDSEKAKIDKMLEGITDEREKTKKLYYYLQDQTRYINVDIKIGGLQTYPAEYVSINKYGDCKALSNYMMSMLAYSGIKSYYTLIHANDKVYDIDSDFPSQEFNHVILTVPLSTDTIYLECTSKNIPFGYIHTSIQGRQAFVIDEHNSHFTTIPAMTREEVLCSRTFTVTPNISSGASDIKLIAEERGKKYELSNYLATDINRNEADKYIRNTLFVGSYDLKDYKIEKPDRDNALISTNLNCKMFNTTKKYGNNIALLPYPITISTYETPEKRSQNLQIDYPQFNRDTIIYILDNIIVSKMPQDISLKTDFGHYTLKFEKKDNKVIIYKSLFIAAGRYDLSEYNKFYEFISKIKHLESINQYIEIQ